MMMMNTYHSTTSITMHKLRFKMHRRWQGKTLSNFHKKSLQWNAEKFLNLSLSGYK